MKASSKLTLLSLSVVMAVACGEAPKPAPAAAPAATAAPVVAATVAAAAVSEFGVPECDDYITKYLACVDSKVPEAARAATRQGFEQAKAGWKQAAATPEGKTGLAAACTQAKEAAKTAMAAYGCTF